MITLQVFKARRIISSGDKTRALVWRRKAREERAECEVSCDEAAALQRRKLALLTRLNSVWPRFVQANFNSFDKPLKPARKMNNRL